MTRSLALACLLMAHVASAQPPTTEREQDEIDRAAERARARERRRAENLRTPLLIVEHATIVVPPLYVYWHTVDDQKEDWEMKWTWHDWKSKLTSTKPLVLDTNRFVPNGLRHPLVGALTYQTGRANGLGPIASTLIDVAGSLFWEYVAEYRERPSVNDMFTNAAGGVLLGEPMFALGQLADRRPTPLRRLFSLIASPYHRAQREVHLSPLGDAPESPNRLEAIVGTSASSRGMGGTDGELRLGLDLEMYRDPGFGEPGQERRSVGLGDWNRVAFDMRAGGDGMTGGRFRSVTTFWGRSYRDYDESGLGHMTFVGFGGVFDASLRSLTGNDLDRLAVFQLANPRLGNWWRTEYGDVDVELGGAGDVAMVQSMSRLGIPLEMDSSLLLTRGYYYATGVTAQARVRARRGIWGAELESTAHKFWSFDDHDYRGDNDPKDLTDQRLFNTAALRVSPTSAWTFEVFGNANLRTGSDAQMTRTNRELEAGLAVRARF